jgi:DNA invertase Pin-like site-specific DNA recombinase
MTGSWLELQRSSLALGAFDNCGSDSNRRALTRLLEYAREGDTVVVHSLDRLGRNLDDLRIVSGSNQRGITVQFVKEGLTSVGDDTPMSKLLFNVLGAFAEFERSLIRERQREGIELAKKEGKYRGF